jgi:hypothetical protein
MNFSCIFHIYSISASPPLIKCYCLRLLLSDQRDELKESLARLVGERDQAAAEVRKLGRKDTYRRTETLSATIKVIVFILYILLYKAPSSAVRKI